MTGDAFLTEPAGGVGRAMQAGARTPLLDQEFDSGTLYALRAAVQAHASRAGLSEDRVGEVVLAVHELAANAIAHGAGHGRLRMWDLAGALSCEIVDGWPRRQRGRCLQSRRRGRCPESRRRGRCLQSGEAGGPRPWWIRGRPWTATACGWCGRWPTSWTYGQGSVAPGPWSPSRCRCRRIIDGWTKRER